MHQPDGERIAVLESELRGLETELREFKAEVRVNYIRKNEAISQQWVLKSIVVLLTGAVVGLLSIILRGLIGSA